jgi:hypothetical protein
MESVIIYRKVLFDCITNLYRFHILYDVYTMTIIDINTGKEKELEYFDCTICNCKFSEQEGGLQRGLLGMLVVSFCPTCFAGLLDMAEYFRGDDGKEE